MIAQQILDGRQLVEQYRLDHEEMYISGDLSNHDNLTETLRSGLESLGFESIGAFMHASLEADNAEGVEERWI